MIQDMDHEELHVTNLADLEDWLEHHHDQKESVWLVYYKPTNPKGDVTYSKLVDSLLCFGWVDSMTRKVDDDRTSIRISPRNPKSNWSRVNKQKIATLQKAGRMRPSGKALVALAKKTGTWDALNDVENLVIPPELGKALRKAKLTEAWHAKSRTWKRGWLEKLLNAKKPETRLKRIDEILQALKH